MEVRAWAACVGGCGGKPLRQEADWRAEVGARAHIDRKRQQPADFDVGKLAIKELNQKCKKRTNIRKKGRNITNYTQFKLSTKPIKLAKKTALAPR